MMGGEGFQYALCAVFAFGDKEDTKSGMLEFKGRGMGILGCVPRVQCKSFF